MQSYQCKSIVREFHTPAPQWIQQLPHTEMAKRLLERVHTKFVLRTVQFIVKYIYLMHYSPTHRSIHRSIHPMDLLRLVSGENFFCTRNHMHTHHSTSNFERSYRLSSFVLMSCCQLLELDELLNLLKLLKLVEMLEPFELLERLKLRD